MSSCNNYNLTQMTGGAAKKAKKHTKKAAKKSAKKHAKKSAKKHAKKAARKTSKRKTFFQRLFNL